MDWVDIINTKAQYNIALGIEAGLKIPEVLFLGQIPEDKNKEIMSDPNWIILHDAGIAMQNIYGGVTSTHYHWYEGGNQGAKFIGVNFRELLSGGQGPHLVDNCMTIWRGETINARLQACIQQLDSIISKNDPDYFGMVCVEVTLVDNICWYRSIRLGLSPMEHVCLEALYEKPLDHMISHPKEFPTGFCAGCRVYAYPYDIKDNEIVVAPWLDTGLFIPMGTSYATIGKARTIREVWGLLYSRMRKFSNAGICFREDAGIKSRTAFYMLKKGKYV